MAKLYIDNFCHDLNYSNVILYIGGVNKTKLFNRLAKNYVNHLYRFDKIINDPKAPDLMYIENCDLQDLTFEPYYYISEGYTIVTLREDTDGRYYIQIEI